MATSGDSGVWRNENGKVFVSNEIVQEVRSFSVVRQLDHCGEEFTAPALSITATCPKCGIEIKIRATSACTELEDLFDAFIEWSLLPGASDLIDLRRAAILADTEE